MLLRRYGATLQSVEIDFDSKALNEVGFRRDRKVSIDAEDFARDYVREDAHTMSAEAEGYVHDEVEQATLNRLEAHIHDILAGVVEQGGVVVIENEQGGNWPKTRQATRNVVLEGENRLHFRVHVDPPLELGVYRPVS